LGCTVDPPSPAEIARRQRAGPGAPHDQWNDFLLIAPYR
jgi:hypothetical protein